LLAVLSLTIDDAAVQWIDANLPKAWYRAVFVHDYKEPPNV
jgi:hypothetical protein